MSDGGLADRLHTLFAAKRTPEGRRLSNAILAADLRERGVDVSREYLRQLCKGTRTNPRLELVEALADYFGVSTAYLLDGTRHESLTPVQGPVEAEHVLVSFFGPPARGKSDLIRRILAELPCDQSVIIIPASKPATMVTKIDGQQFTSRAMLEEIQEWLDVQLSQDEDTSDDGPNATQALVIPKS